MATPTKIPSTEDAWDSRQLGADEEFVRVSKDVDEAKLDSALGLKPVSIRLQTSLIEDFKIIAKLNGIGYQSLMRQVLTRFVDCEKKQIMRDFLRAQDIEDEADANNSSAKRA